MSVKSHLQWHLHLDEHGVQGSKPHNQPFIQWCGPCTNFPKDASECYCTVLAASRPQKFHFFRPTSLPNWDPTFYKADNYDNNKRTRRCVFGV